MANNTYLLLLYTIHQHIPCIINSIHVQHLVYYTQVMCFFTIDDSDYLHHVMGRILPVDTTA